MTDTPRDPDVEALADLFMDLRLNGPSEDGWTYQQQARHYARIILGRWLAGIRRDPSGDEALRAAAETLLDVWPMPKAREHARLALAAALRDREA